MHFQMIFLIMFLSIFLHLKTASVFCQCLQDQQSSLLQLKQSLVFDPTLSSKLMTWNSSTDCCSWEGVTCDGGHIIGLDLSAESLSGGIDNSSSLFDFQHLQSLNLANNRFNTAPIPFGLGKLVNLHYLNLSNAEFSGKIPFEISRLTRLVSLDLSSPYYSGYPRLKLEYPNLSMLVLNLTKVTVLNLRGVNISAEGYEWCHALSTSLPNLQVLNLASCFLSGPIDSSLVKLRSLSAINLDDNNLSSQVPEFFVNFSNLTSLHLSYCGLYGIFPQKIFQITTLETLDISINHLLHGFLPEFPRNGSLRTLVLSETNFSGTLPQSIGNLKMLSILELASCNFSGPIRNSISTLMQLVSLDFSYNGFTGSIPSFSMSKNLTEIILSHNDFTGQITSTHWENLLNLLNLDLCHNSLKGSIPLSLFSLPSLQRLQLSNNQFAGQIDEFQIASSYELDTLDLSSNKLEGPIPMSVFELGGLNILRLSSNNFNGNIELSIFQKLRNLSSLDLSFNNLSIDAGAGNSNLFAFPKLVTLKLASCNLRTFPCFLRNQSMISSLDLSHNHIHGKIPSWVWKFDYLHQVNLSCNFMVNLEGPYVNFTSLLSMVDLHSNLLQGQIPILAPSPTYLDYSNNKFSSEIPADMGNFLSFTYFFSVSSNNLHGIIPESVCNSLYLKVLDLSYNSLSGTIPRCLIEMKTLGVLNLRRNSLNSTVPDTFPGICGLQTLDLNENLLEGKLPKSLANCKMLEVVDIGNNQINGTFPCWLRNISTLHVLVLRSNKFHGSIRCPRRIATWPTLQIVDLASNNFSGKLPQEYFKSWTAMMADENVAKSKLNHLQFEFMLLNELYYQDAVTVTNKGLEMELVKILTIFTSIDFSCNFFKGPIPESMGELKSLYVLNLSHNALTGQIPSSFGKLRQLESLDLSWNNLSGEIPLELASLTFLSFLNLSYNQLGGDIPTSTQLQSFSEASYKGNKGLCGIPLNLCRIEDGLVWSPPRPEDGHSNSGIEIDWNFISAELGFVFGLGISIGSLVFWKRWRKWYYKQVDCVLSRILPQQDQRNRYHGRKVLRDRNGRH